MTVLLTLGGWLAFIAHSYGVLWVLQHEYGINLRSVYLMAVAAMYGLITYSYMGLLFSDRTYTEHVEFISYVGVPIMLHTVVLLIIALRRGGFNE